MAWMQSVVQRMTQYQNSRVDEKDPFVRQLVHFLREESGMEYTRTVLEHTVKDVLALDADLLAFVKKFIMGNQVDTGDLACEPYFTMAEFLENTGYNPVTAAIYFQMYRQNKAAALKTFLMQDIIAGEPEGAERKDES